ncbi:MAG: AAC(3) family N-acetyltransferase [Ruminococcus sp.]|nr:AAC(3) family N-acetyltransferase [Ruminococcus sp.]
METKNTVTAAQLKEALIELGVEPGMTLEVHCSLSSFGRLEGGAMTVIDTLKETVTGQGSIFMPALRLSRELELTEEDRRLGITVKIKILPPGTQRTAMGIVADTFRCLPDTLCGDGVISTAGWGRYAQEAVNSGLDQAVFHGGKALLLGVDIYKLTAMHYVEDVTPPEIGGMFAPGEEINKVYPPEEWMIEAGHPPVKAWYTVQRLAFGRGLIREMYIGPCRAMFFDIHDVVSIYRGELIRDPYGLWGLPRP